MPTGLATTKQHYTAGIIERLAIANNLVAVVTENDVLAHNLTRLSGDDVNFYAIETTIVALQRAGVLDRVFAVRLHARYLREAARHRLHRAA